MIQSSSQSDTAPAILGIIAARGGSKGIPRKNIKRLAGKPLIAYAIQAASQSRQLTRFVVSTDDDEIAQVARAWGADVPFRRPAELATDQANQIDVLIHATQWVERQENRRYQAIVVLQPTSPLRTAQDIDQAVTLLDAHQADTVFSLTAAAVHPYYMYQLEGDRPTAFCRLDFRPSNRQDFPPAYLRNGAVYAVRRDLLMNQRTLYGTQCRAFLMPPERSLNLDTPRDWQYAEFVLGGSSCR